MSKVTPFEQILSKINLVIVSLLLLLVMAALIFPFGDSWKWFPVFGFHLQDSDKLIQVFAHAFLFGFNLGFFLQLFVIVFSFMVYFARKSIISFQMIYIVLILRSILILIQSSTPPENYIAHPGEYSVHLVQIAYLTLFGGLFILNIVIDHKKRPRIPEPYELKEN